VTPAAICTFAPSTAASTDDRGLQLVLELVERVAQRLRVGAVEPRREHLEALDVDRLRGEVAALRRREPPLHRGELLLERLDVLEHLADARRHFGGRRAQGAGELLDGALERLQVGERVLAGDRLDPADAGGDAALGDDLEEADVAGALHVRSAAELAARADVEHAHLVAVLLAEQHHRAELLRLVDRHHPRVRRMVLQDLGVDELLDLPDLLVGQRRVVHEVEAGAVGVDERALLLHMLAEHLAQRLVHQVGGAVVAHGAGAALGVDLGVEAVADLDLALDDASLVAEHRGLDLDRVLDEEARGRVAQLAGVADLAARLGIERRVVEDDDGVVAGAGRARGAAVDVDASTVTLVARSSS
jgi:hypothetical protein